jgi:hypothetical protein
MGMWQFNGGRNGCNRHLRLGGMMITMDDGNCLPLPRYVRQLGLTLEKTLVDFIDEKPLVMALHYTNQELKVTKHQRPIQSEVAYCLMILYFLTHTSVYVSQQDADDHSDVRLFYRLTKTVEAMGNGQPYTLSRFKKAAELQQFDATSMTEAINVDFQESASSV